MQKNNNTVKAINKNVRCSPRKIGLVLDYIRGKNAEIALKDLEFCKKKVAKGYKQNCEIGCGKC